MPNNIANIFLVTQNLLDIIAGTFIMMQMETDEIASRYPKHVNKVNIFFAKPQSKFL